MSKIKDETGQTFGRLTVLEKSEEKISNLVSWKCRCVCGNIRIAPGVHLRNGNISSCGCLRYENSIQSLTLAWGKIRKKHGKCNTPEYNTWQSMKARCFNRGNQSFHLYGGRGITVCDRWKDNFLNFLNDMGKRPEDTSLDRIDVNGNYEPSNCRWATIEEQNRNRRQKYLETTQVHCPCCNKTFKISEGLWKKQIS